MNASSPLDTFLLSIGEVLFCISSLVLLSLDATYLIEYSYGLDAFSPIRLTNYLTFICKLSNSESEFPAGWPVCCQIMH